MKDYYNCCTKVYWYLILYFSTINKPSHTTVKRAIPYYQAYILVFRLKCTENGTATKTCDTVVATGGDSNHLPFFSIGRVEIYLFTAKVLIVTPDGKKKIHEALTRILSARVQEYSWIREYSRIREHS